MNEMKIFHNADFGDMRVVDVNGTPYFVGKDVAGVLGYSDTNKAISMHVDDEDKLNDKTASSLGQRGGWLINESGLYSLVFSSKLPTAKKFKHWVTSEVLPAIRKSGVYMSNFNDLFPQLQLLINIERNQMEQQKAIEAANRRIDSIGEVIALDVHSWREDAHKLIAQIAKQNGGFDSIKDVFAEVYRLMEQRAGGVTLHTSDK